MVVHVKLKSKLWLCKQSSRVSCGNMYSSRANCGYICVAQEKIRHLVAKGSNLVTALSI